MFGNSDIGCVRKVNQDYIVFEENIGYGLVADGIGGRPGGDVASKLVVESISNAVINTEKIRFDSVASFMVAEIDRANMKLIQFGEKNHTYKGLGTTLNFVFFLGAHLYIAHIGDSRTYLFFREHLFQMTIDHNLGTFINRGLISSNSALKNSNQAALTRAVGLSNTVEVDVLEKKISDGEIYLTASDGLFDMVDDTVIRRIISEYQGRLQDLPDRLILEAKRNGGKDNITVLVSRVVT